MIDSDTIVRCQDNKREISILLVMIDSERIDLGKMETAEIDWSKFDVGKAVEGLNEEEKAEKLGQIEMIREMQKKVNKLKNILEILKRRKEEERREAERQRKREEEETDR